ncbi:MAG: polysaccharide deacetylase family protein [Corallococcus sp.]|nr:polysaccharide deacetylase family protein [Corallococcus sp.]
MLKTLDEYGCKTTFFVGGYWVSHNQDVFMKIVSSGHEIANHGYHHKDQSKLDYAGNCNEIVTCGKLVESICGITPTLFAPPSGAFSDNTLQAAFDNGYRTIMWSRDTVDWRDKSRDLVYKRCTEKISGGELILMHPTKHTSEALQDILRFYDENGFKVVPVGQNINGNG